MAKSATAFKTMYDRPETIDNPTGTEYDNTYEVEIEKGSHKVLKKTGKTNRYEKIQAFAEETDIKNILARAVIDPTVLNQKMAQYADFTKMPKTLAELQNTLIKANKDFMELPTDIRAKFGNSVEIFVQEMGTKEWAEKLGYKAEIKAAPEIKEGTNDESEQ